jgi:hypothetical protein
MVAGDIYLKTYKAGEAPGPIECVKRLFRYKAARFVGYAVALYVSIAAVAVFVPAASFLNNTTYALVAAGAAAILHYFNLRSEGAGLTFGSYQAAFDAKEEWPHGGFLDWLGRYPFYLVFLIGAVLSIPLWGAWYLLKGILYFIMEQTGDNERLRQEDEARCQEQARLDRIAEGRTIDGLPERVAERIEASYGTAFPAQKKAILDTLTDLIAGLFIPRVYAEDLDLNAYEKHDSEYVYRLLEKKWGQRPDEMLVSKSLEAFRNFFDALPSFVSNPPLFTSPLSQVLPSEVPVYWFFDTFDVHPGTWRLRYWFNLNRGYLLEDHKEGFPDDPAVYRKLIKGYFPDVPFPVSLPRELRFEGTWIVAPQGTGKTTLLSRMLKFDLEEVKKGKASIVILDSKGELTDNAKRLAVFDAELKGKLLLIEPSSTLAINPLDLGGNIQHTIGLIEYLFSFGMGTTPKQAMLFRSILIAIAGIPNANLSTFRRFLREGWEPFREHIEKLHPEDRDFFMKPGLGGKSEFDNNDYMPTRQELLVRIQDLITKVPILRQMFSAKQTLLKLGEAMDDGKVIVINNSTQILGDAGSEFFGRLFLALIRGEAQKREGRADEDKLPCYVYIDECDVVMKRDENVATILSKCRSQKIALILAHQRLSQIEADKVSSALRDSGIRIANSDDEAPELASRMRMDIGALRSMGKGQFAVFMRRYTKRGIVCSVENDHIANWPKMSDGAFARIKREMEEQLCFEPEVEVEDVKATEAADDTAPARWT